MTHGTETGYSTHRKRDEKACSDCLAAHRKYVNQQNEKNRPMTAQLPTFTPAPWMRHGNCNGLDPDLFFPTRGTLQHEIDYAKSFCQTCPVQAACLEYALVHPDGHWGIWGGTSDRERRRIRRQRRLDTAA